MKYTMGAPMVDIVAINSSSVRGIGYDEDRHALYVRFIDGETYEYFNVPVDDFSGLLQAKSIGRFVNKHIKPYYDYRSSKRHCDARSEGQRPSLVPMTSSGSEVTINWIIFPKIQCRAAGIAGPLVLPI
jgi:hypothetical protein